MDVFRRRSQENPKRQKVLISAVIGLIIILLSWAIVNFIINGMNGGPGGPGVVVLPPAASARGIIICPQMG